MNGPAYIWAFPGLGKSSIHSELNIIDADCEQFKYVFPDGIPKDLHQAKSWDGVQRNLAYPDNYLEFIRSADADIVLLNCHIHLLKELNKEKLLLIYPSADLKEEYLKRYVRRGDNDSYIAQMRASFENMVQVICSSPYRKIEVKSPHIYLENILDGGSIMGQFITKKELSQLLKESIELGIYTPLAGYTHESTEALAQKVFEGTIDLDVSVLKEKVAREKAVLAREAEKTQRRGGLTHDELSDKILQGITNGALGICYGEIAPYCHGYEVTFGGTGTPGFTGNYTNRWTIYSTDFFCIPTTIANDIAYGRQNDAVFGSKCGPLDIHKILGAIEEMESQKITSFTPERDTNFVRATCPHLYPYRSSVASVMDVHAGKGLDGIVQHHYHGDYSTLTPVAQNNLVETLVYLKGFCLDCINKLDISPDGKKNIIEYLKKCGTDISTPEKLNAWIMANPDKCGLPENRPRKPSLGSRIQAATAKAFASKEPASNIKDHSPEH